MVALHSNRSPPFFSIIKAGNDVANTIKNGTTIPSEDPTVKPFSKLPIKIIINKNAGETELAIRSLEKFNLDIFAIKSPINRLKKNPNIITIKTIIKSSILKNIPKKKNDKKLLIKKPQNI
jgi:hypothetical protein